VLSWGLYRRPAAEKDDLVAVARASQQSAEGRVELETMSRVLGQTWAEKIAEESWTKGLSEGLAEGQLLNSRKILRRQLERRFGPLPESLVRDIESCSDGAALESALDQVLEIRTLEEFRLGREDAGSRPSDTAPE
jgi:hypothetical protein